MYRTRVRISLPTFLLFVCLAGCNNDALYSYCTEDDQCGSRTYDDGDTEVEVFLTCIEVTIPNVGTPPRSTRGNFCTIDCFSNAECDSRIGLNDGRCITLAGDDIGFCYQRCDDQPCYPSSSCETLMLSGTPRQVCVPIRTPD